MNPEPDEEDDPEISVGGAAGRTEDDDEDYYDIDETGTDTGGSFRKIFKLLEIVLSVAGVFSRNLSSLYISFIIK